MNIIGNSFFCKDGQSRTIRHFLYTEWPEQGVPKVGEGFIDFIGQVHKTKEGFGQDGPIVVHCSAGKKFKKKFFCNKNSFLMHRCGKNWGIFNVKYCPGKNQI